VSVQQVKTELERMSATERAQVQGYLRILRWKESPGLTERLANAHRAMDAGRKIGPEQVDAHLSRIRAQKQ